MANQNCSACEDLRQDAPNLMINGLGDDECKALKTNKGLSTANGNDDCEDLENLNDCLVGNMASEVSAYNSCDWKTFMKRFIPNVWTTLKGIICAICGIWTNIEKLHCLVNYLFDGASFSFGEDSTGSSKLIPGKGVDFKIRSASQSHTSDVTILYVAGGLSRLYGSLRLFIEDYKDVDGNTKSGNSVWDITSGTWSSLPSGGERLYDLLIKKSEYPQIKRLYDGDLFYTGGHNRFIQAHVNVFDGDDTSTAHPKKYAYGQHGWCDDDGNPSEAGYSDGIEVKPGYIRISVRLSHVDPNFWYLSTHTKDGAGNDKKGSDMTLGGYLGIRMDRGKIDC